MQMELSRVDYMVVGLTCPQTMKLLPSQSSRLNQKVALADQDGILQVFSLKKGEIQQGFKTLPGPCITRVELGGAIGTVQDKVFVSSENEVRGYTKKGKMFLGFDTNLTENIRSMHISGSNLLVSGKHAYNQYHDCKDTNSYLCGDEINDIIALSAEKLKRLVPVLACDDRMIRVLDHSKVLHSLELESAPSVLHLYDNEGGESGDELLYGTVDGRVGLLQVGRTELQNKWIIHNELKRGGVTCIHCYDITGDGTKDLLIGRLDGSIEVYSVGEDMEEESKWIRKFGYTCNESITSIQGGIIGNSGCDEIVGTTFTGWLFGLTTEVMDKQVVKDSQTGSISISQDAKLKIMRLRAEVDELEKQVVRERERYQDATQDRFDGYSAIPFISINDKMILCKEDASYMLMLEVQTAIDNVLIQSDVPVDLLDTDRNSAVVSYSDCDMSSGNYLLATYRCQMNTTRLELKVRTIEGQYGTLRAYITPLIQPKCCQMRQYKIKPLSLHTRCHTIDPKRPYTILNLKGAFSLAEVHSWVSFCLPEIPEKPPSGEKVSFTFTSTFIDTMLHCEYSKGEAEFQSDNVSTISILKDILTKEATNKKIKLEISCAVNEQSVPYVLNLLHPKLQSQLDLAKKISLLEALKELQAYEGDAGCLLPVYRDIVDNEKQLQAEHKKQPAQLERLYGMITDLYIDMHKFKGVNVKGKVPQLLDTLDKYDLQNLLQFFKQQSSS